MSPRILIIAILVIAGTRESDARAERKLSVMIEPMFLVLPMVDATVEYQVTPHVGIAAIAGYGKVLFTSTLYDLGGQGNIYLKQDFRGWHLGSEVRVLWGDSDMSLFGGPSKKSFAHERVVGIYGGYKWITSWGFTAVVELGIGRLDMTSSSEPPYSQVIPVGNLNVGWSF